MLPASNDDSRNAFNPAVLLNLAALIETSVRAPGCSGRSRKVALRSNLMTPRWDYHIAHLNRPHLAGHGYQQKCDSKSDCRCQRILLDFF